MKKALNVTINDEILGKINSLHEQSMIPKSRIVNEILNDYFTKNDGKFLQ